MYTSSRLSPSTELTKCSVASVLIGVLLDNLGLNLPHGFFPMVETALRRQERVDKPLSNATGGLQSVSLAPVVANKARALLSRYCRGMTSVALYFCFQRSRHIPEHGVGMKRRSSSLMADRMRFCWSSKFDTLIDRRTNPS